MSDASHKVIGLTFVAFCVAVGTGLALAGNDEVTPQSNTTAPAKVVQIDRGHQVALEEDPVTQSVGDAELDFGGASVGMDYEEFRNRLIDSGFIPLEAELPEECSANPDYADCNYQYPETESCSGTGEAFCRYHWYKGDDDFMVITREGEGGQVVEMSYIR